METLVEICLGISLSAACGLRIFVPPLVMGIMARWGFLHLGAGSDWMASTPALVALGVALSGRRTRLAHYSLGGGWAAGDPRRCRRFVCRAQR